MAAVRLSKTTLQIPPKRSASLSRPVLRRECSRDPFIDAALRK
jgi:hypothetical protein